MSTPRPFHFPHVDENRNIASCLYIILSFLRTRLSLECQHPWGPKILAIYSSPHSHRLLPRETQTQSMKNAGRMHRDLICITILAYVFCRHSLRRYVGTQQVPYALGCLYPECRNVGHACICRITGRTTMPFSAVLCIYCVDLSAHVSLCMHARGRAAIAFV